MGGTVLALGAARDPRIAAMAFAATPGSLFDSAQDESEIFSWAQDYLKLITIGFAGIDGYKTSAKDASSEISPRPILVIQGKEDHVVPIKRATQLFAGAKQPKALLILPHSGHGT